MWASLKEPRYSNWQKGGEGGGGEGEGGQKP